MTMLAFVAAGLMAVTAVAHSALGERKLIGPLIRLNAGVMESAHSRMLLRLTWHFTSLLMVVTAIIVALPDTARGVRMLVGGGYLLAGLMDAALTRGRHVGWPLLTAAGVAALAS